MVMWGSMLQGLAEGYKTGSDIYARSQTQKLQREELEQKKKEREIDDLRQAYELEIIAARDLPEPIAVERVNNAGEPYFNALGLPYTRITSYGTKEQRATRKLADIGKRRREGKITSREAKDEANEVYLSYDLITPAAAYEAIGVAETEKQRKAKVKMYSYDRTFRALDKAIKGDGSEFARLGGREEDMPAGFRAVISADPEAGYEGMREAIDDIIKLNKKTSMTDVEFFREDPKGFKEYQAAKRQGALDEFLDLDTPPATASGGMSQESQMPKPTPHPQDVEGTIIVNPETGERMKLQGDKWIPIPRIVSEPGMISSPIGTRKYRGPILDKYYQLKSAYDRRGPLFQ